MKYIYHYCAEVQRSRSINRFDGILTMQNEILTMSDMKRIKGMIRDTENGRGRGTQLVIVSLTKIAEIDGGQ